MRHRVAKKHFNRDTNNRKALLKNLLRSLVERGEITTTTSKAKEIKRLMDKVVGKAKVNSVENRRLLHRLFGRRDVVNTLVERVAPAMGDRISGFTTISKASIRRGDSSKMSTLKFIAEYEGVGSLKSGKDYSETKKKVKPAAKKTIKKAAPKTKAVTKKPKTEAKKK
jgi:large subunit ribosomal protein L17